MAVVSCGIAAEEIEEPREIPLIIPTYDYWVLLDMTNDSPIFADEDGNIGEFTFELSERRLEGAFGYIFEDGLPKINLTELIVTRRGYIEPYSTIYLDEVAVLVLWIFDLPDEEAVETWLDYRYNNMDLVRRVDRGEGELPAVVGLTGDTYQLHWSVGNKTIAWLSYVPCERGRSAAAEDLMQFDQWIAVIPPPPLFNSDDPN